MSNSLAISWRPLLDPSDAWPGWPSRGPVESEISQLRKLSSRAGET